MFKLKASHSQKGYREQTLNVNSLKEAFEKAYLCGLNPQNGWNKELLMNEQVVAQMKNGDETWRII